MRNYVAALMVGLFSFNTFADRPVINPDLIKNAQAAKNKNLNHKTSTYSVNKGMEATRMNWLYVGYAPRMQDPSRIALTISKLGHTVRVTLQMTEKEVAEYPKYLSDRADKIVSIFGQRGLNVTQPTLLARYHAQIALVKKSDKGTFESGLAWLQYFYPENVFVLPEAKANGVRVIAHFVYPVTTVSPAKGSTAPEGTYYTYSFEERKDKHQYSYQVQEEDPDTHEMKTVTKWSTPDYVFGGFPALWFLPTPNGIGIHGPIRYSERGERDAPNKQLQEEFWAENEIKNFGYNKQVDLEKTAKTRWDLVRTQDSSGCVRTEIMEIRHLLPSEVSKITQVPIVMTYKWDKIEVDGKSQLVNVDYYAMDPYKPQWTREQWLQKHDPKMLTQMDQFKHFPYLDPSTIEFENKSKWGDLTSMTLLNRAPL